MRRPRTPRPAVRRRLIPRICRGGVRSRAKHLFRRAIGRCARRVLQVWKRVGRVHAGHRDTGRVKGIAFVKFAIQAEADDAVDKATGMDLLGREIRCEIAQDRRKTADEMRTAAADAAGMVIDGGGYDDRRGGYGDRRGGYDDRRGGYDDRRGGYDDRRGGYGRRDDRPYARNDRPRGLLRVEGRQVRSR